MPVFTIRRGDISKTGLSDEEKHCHVVTATTAAVFACLIQEHDYWKMWRGQAASPGAGAR